MKTMSLCQLTFPLLRGVLKRALEHWTRRVVFSLRIPLELPLLVET